MTFKNFQQMQFYKSADLPQHFPEDDGIEVVFAGRSNAGKSTVINSIANQKIARVSKTPGRTRLINFFTVSPQKYIVDLPGFGYAKVPVKMQAHWQSVLAHYFTNRQALQAVILIMDIRHPLKDTELQMLDYCNTYKIKTHILLNKADKISKNLANQTMLAVNKELSEFTNQITIQIYSTPKKIGLDEFNNKLNEFFGY